MFLNRRGWLVRCNQNVSCLQMSVLRLVEDFSSTLLATDPSWWWMATAGTGVCLPCSAFSKEVPESCNSNLSSLLLDYSLVDLVQNLPHIGQSKVWRWGIKSLEVHGMLVLSYGAIASWVLGPTVDHEMVEMRCYDIKTIGKRLMIGCYTIMLIIEWKPVCSWGWRE